MQEEIKKLKEEFEKDIVKINSCEDVESLRVKYLGRKAQIHQFFTSLKNLNISERQELGRLLNELKKNIENTLQEKENFLKQKQIFVDITLPGRCLEVGGRHILSKVNEDICLIFQKLGFEIFEGSEIENEWYNFSALNIPLEHPSRDVFDTFYLTLPPSAKGKYLLRSHTSPSQIRVLEKKKPPIAVISPGRVYRPDEVDATHSFMFHQIEGFCVDKDINFSHLKGVLLAFVQQYFSFDARLRFRPHFFPFTEPSAEVDISCIICSNKRDKSAPCSVCKDKGWLEILGCGMIHPNVLKNCGIDPHKYKGFAFGMGLERIVMLKYSINDIRLFYENDERFLNQFYGE